MKVRIVVLGAGFGGLELTTILSERIGDRINLTLIDRNDSFYFGFSKLDLMFGRKSAEAVKISYRNIVKPGVRFRQETITAIDPLTKRVTTRNGTYEADILVVALGADYNIDATPGLAEGGNEFYSFTGAERVGKLLPAFKKGHVIVGVTSTPFKCPPAPSETALLLHEYLTRRGVRHECKISLVIPFTLPIPPSLGTSKALLKAFAELDGGEYALPYDGKGTCYVEFGQGQVGRADVDFFSGPSATGIFYEASETLAAEKENFETSRRERWFSD